MREDAAYRILFVCMGNICRSPAGENIMRALAKKEGVDGSLFCDSAGTIDFHRGKPPDSRVCAAAASHGYVFPSLPKPLCPRFRQHLIQAHHRAQNLMVRLIQCFKPALKIAPIHALHPSLS